jgi:hypothetical protein
VLFLEGQETPRRSVSNVDSVHDDEGNVTNHVSTLLKCYYNNLFIVNKIIQSIKSESLFGLDRSEDVEYSVSDVNEVYGSASPSVGSSVYSSQKSSHSRKRKVDPADNMVNTVAQKLQSEGKYKAFGKHTAHELASLGDEMAKYCKKIINDDIFEAQMGTLNRTSRIFTETTQQPLPCPQTSTPHTAAVQGRHCFGTTSFSHSHTSSDVTTGQHFSIFQVLHTLILINSNRIIQII